MSCPICRKFSCSLRKSANSWMVVQVPCGCSTICLHCQGVAHHNGTAWVVLGSMLERLALIFALQRSQSHELDAQVGASDDLHLAPQDQHLKPWTHLLPNF